MNIVTYNIFSIHNSNKLEQQIIDDQNLVFHILVKRSEKCYAYKDSK